MLQNVLLMNRRLFLTLFFPLFLAVTTTWAQSGFFMQDSVILKLKNCNGTEDFCFEGINPSVTPDLKITVDGVPIIPPYSSCRTDTVFQYITPNIDPAIGPFRLDSVTIGSKKYKNKLFPSAEALRDSLNLWDPAAKWIYDAASKRLTGTPKLKYSPIVYTIVTSGLPNTIGVSSAFIPKGLKLSFLSGVHKVVASGGIPLVTDSLYMIVACSKKTEISRSIKVGESRDFCFDPANLPARVVAGISPTLPVTSTVVSLAPGATDSCVLFKGLKAGKDTFGFVLKGLNGINDTTILYMTVIGAGKIGKREADINVEEGKTNEYCIDTDALLAEAGQTITSVTNYCGSKSGKGVKFTITGTEKCIKIEGIKAGLLDTACIVAENTKGQKDTTIIYARVIKACKGLIAVETLFGISEDCVAKGEICLPNFKAADTTKYTFLADGLTYKDETALCDFQDISGISYVNLFDDASGKLIPFPYSIESWGVNGQAFNNGGLVNSLEDIVKKLNEWNPAGDWKLDTVNRFFRGGNKNNKYDNLYLVNQVLFTEHLALFNFGTTANGIAFYFNIGLHNLTIVENATGCVDTILAVVHCAQSNVVETEIFVGQKDTFCIDVKRLAGKDITFTNNAKVGQNVTFQPSADKRCVYFTGNKIGKDSITIVACDEYKICDTTKLYVEVVKRVKNQVKIDSIDINGSGQICIDTTFATGAIKSFTNISTKSGASVKFILDSNTKCVNYTGTSVIGTDTAVVVICDDKDLCDTTTIYVAVRPKIVNPTSDIVRDTVNVGSSITYCLPKNKFDLPLTSPLTVKNICEKTTNKDVNFTIQQTSSCNGAANFGYALIYTGAKIGTDTACVEVTDASGKKDTLRVLVTVVPKKNFQYRDTILQGTSDVYCIDARLINIKGEIDSVINICPTSSKDVKFTIGLTVNCLSGYGIRYEGLKPGTDTACVVVKDKLGNIDTFPAYITVNALKAQPKLVLDTIFTFQTKTYCIDTSQLNLSGGLDSIWNACPNSSGEEVVFDVNKTQSCTTVNGGKGLTIIYTGAERGRDTACFVIADDIGQLDTITFIVTVIPPAPSIIKDKVEIGKTLTICPDTTQLFGRLTSVKNVCPTSSGKDAKFVIDTVTKCVRVEGLKIGVDTACIVVCSEFLVCDTTTMIIEVVPVGAASITATDDADETSYPKPIVIQVLENDKFDLKDTSIIDIKILAGKEPKHGSAIVDIKTRTIRYVPDPNVKYCGKDTFQYYIRVGVRTDTATVIVTIKCDDDKGPYKVYNAFSPNDDDKNETFTITGLGNFPDNELIVYNRWGSQVYRKKNYDNTWNGTWEGKEVPDGTYFYILCLPQDNGPVKIESGYIEIRR